jgi:GGDEF domain-containing protein
MMFLLTAVYALYTASRSHGTVKVRHRAIGIASLAMTLFVTIQSLFPLLPMFAIGYLLAACLLHTFVLENEKEEYREELEKKLKDNILKGNYYDLLTGLPGMTYFFELTEKKRSEIAERGDTPVFLFMNLSGMKFFNQKYGFDAGNDILWAFSQVLTGEFGSENCSRFGQDHFVAFTHGENLEETLQRIIDDWDEQQGNDAPAIRIGVYKDILYDDDISTACDRAKAACDDIRKTYISSIRYYDEAMLENAEKRRYITTHLDQAIAANWIQVSRLNISRKSEISRLPNRRDEHTALRNGSSCLSPVTARRTEVGRLDSFKSKP